jgi:hypothetical protein
MTGLFRRLTTAAAILLGSAALLHGRDVTLLWDPGSRPDITGYKLHYGTTPRNYTTTVDVGKVTSFTLRDLEQRTYYFAATSYNAAGRESGFSNEVFVGPLTLIYPRLTGTGGGASGLPEFTGVALANLDEAAALLRMQAVDASGSSPEGTGISNPVLVTLSPLHQMPFIEFELFGSGLAAASPMGWAKIESTVAGVSGFFLLFDGNLTLLDGGKANLIPIDSAVLTEIEPDGFTKLSIINPHGAAVDATIDLVQSNGRTRASITRTIRAKEALAGELGSEFFPGVPAPASDYVRVRSSPGLIASELNGKTGRYIQFLAGSDSAAGGTILYSPQYAISDIWHSTLSVVNLDDVDGNVTFRLMAENGGQIGATRELPIVRNGKIHIDDRNFFGPAGAGLVQGYVEVNGGGLKLAGSVVFGDPARSSFSTSLPLVSELRQSLLFGHIASNQTWYTGLAILNPNLAAASAGIAVYGDNGNLIGSKTVPIPPNGRTSGVLTEYFPELKDQNRTSGYIRIQVDRPVAAFALFGTGEGSVLSAIPAQ